MECVLRVVVDGVSYYNRVSDGGDRVHLQIEGVLLEYLVLICYDYRYQSSFLSASELIHEVACLGSKILRFGSESLVVSSSRG